MADCTNCAQMRTENKQLRKNREDIYKNYVEVVNENLALRRELEKSHGISETNNADQ